jgi:hypothetical protein
VGSRRGLVTGGADGVEVVDAALSFRDGAAVGDADAVGAGVTPVGDLRGSDGTEGEAEGSWYSSIQPLVNPRDEMRCQAAADGRAQPDWARENRCACCRTCWVVTELPARVLEIALLFESAYSVTKRKGLGCPRLSQVMS